VIARMGSGSACRSMLDGFVLWKRVNRIGSGTNAARLDSTIAQVMSHREWPQLQGLVVLFSVAEKSVSSSEGMQRTVRTSVLFGTRVNMHVPQHLDAITKALEEKDFASLAFVMMRDSNSFHACCLDSFPPIGYLSADSWMAIDIVHRINEQAGRTVLGYTFDAGPNPVVLAAESTSLHSFRDELECRLSLSGRPGVEMIPFSIGEGARASSETKSEARSPISQ
jgi:diphosphomevalonate decarboxylase